MIRLKRPQGASRRILENWDMGLHLVHRAERRVGHLGESSRPWLFRLNKPNKRLWGIAQDRDQSARLD